jgi:transcriptional regulator with XRE-family HTH domain
MGEIGKKVKKMRIRHRKTLKEIGETIGVDYSNLSKVERGERTPSIEMLEMLADYYKVPVSLFFADDERGEWQGVIRDCIEKGYGPSDVLKLVEMAEEIKKL